MNLNGFEVLLPLIKDGTIDGLYIPYEAKVEGSEEVFRRNELLAIKSRGGTLYMKDGAWANFGYKSLKDFSHSASAGKVMCKTPAGILTLGEVRAVPQRHGYAFLDSLGPVSMAFPLASVAEYREFCAFIEQHLPKVQCKFGSSRFWGLLVAKGVFSPSHYKKMASNLSSRARHTLAILACIFVTATIANFLWAADQIPWWSAVFCSLAFPIICVTLMLRLRHAKTV